MTSELTKAAQQDVQRDKWRIRNRQEGKHVN